MDYRSAELSHALDPDYLARGERYHRLGRVRSVDWRGPRMLAAEVAGSQVRPYACSIQLDRDSQGQLYVDGDCTCPVGYNCKHVAAALLAAAGTRPRTTPGGRDPAIDAWLRDLETASGAAAAYPADLSERLLYVLDLQQFPSGQSRLRVTPMKARQLKKGGYGTAHAYHGEQTDFEARFLLPVDRVLLRQLYSLSPSSVELRLEADWGARLLDDLLATERCHWRSKDNPPLARGAARPGEFRWQIDRDGRQRLRLESEADNLLLPLIPPWYLDPRQDLCGPLDTGLPPRLAGTLVQAPVLPPEAVDTVAQRLQSIASAVPRPQELPQKTHKGITPAPYLRLETRRRSSEAPGSVPGRDDSAQDLALLSFDYAGERVPAGAPGTELLLQREDALWTLPRAQRAENAFRQRLRALGFLPGDDGSRFTLPDASAWSDFLLTELPALRADGWRIDIDPAFRYELAQAEEWYADLEPHGGDWFDLELGVSVDGERVNILPALTTLLNNLPELGNASFLDKIPADRPVPLPLEDGRLLPVPAGRLRPLIQTLLELYDPKALSTDGQLRLPRLRSTVLPELAQTVPLVWSGGEELRRFGQRLEDFDGIAEAPPPAGLRAELRPYQQQGLAWLQFLRSYDLGGVLADDMGLGKTLQTLAHLLLEKDSGRADRPSLVVVPTSLLGNWRREAERFAPELRVLTLHGPQRKTDFATISDYDLVLSTYPLLARDAAYLRKHDYHLLVLDEAQHIKNPRAKAAEIAGSLNARHRLCLTGTPLENHLGELWALFNFLMPGLLGERQQFQRLYRSPIEKGGDRARGEQLKRRIRPFMLRRTKEAVAPELPPRTEILRTAVLEGSQRDLYETVRLSMHERVRAEIARKGAARSHIVILDALLKLRQICCDPRLVKLESARRVTRSAKLELLMELLPELVSEGRRILLFSQFTSMLALIEEALPKRLDYVKLTGSTKDRATPIERFQNGEVPLFLISLKAGGTGLNLTAADTVIHYDPWWNPAVERQATDRAHRIGQDKPVFVYKLLAESTVEEKIAELQRRKAELSAAVLEAGEADTLARLSADDLQALFEPL